MGSGSVMSFCRDSGQADDGLVLKNHPRMCPDLNSRSSKDKEIGTDGLHCTLGLLAIDLGGSSL